MGHMHKNDMSLIAGVTLLSAATGAFVAALFSPRSGREIREDMKDKADDITSKAQEKIDSSKKDL